jgi:beta-glucanase (GH16 family)
MIRYHLFTDGLLSVYGNVNVDYNLADSSAPLDVIPSQIALWDAAYWDDAVWGDNLQPSATWQGVTQIGYSFAPLLKTASQEVQVQWIAADLVFTEGGTL